MIACNLCGKHSATIYFKGIVNEQTIKLHLCAACAKKKGMVFPFGQSVLSLSKVVSDLAQAARPKHSFGHTHCPRCGLTYVEFKQTSQLGCAECFTTFASLLEPLLKKIHGSSQHVGKTAKRTVRMESSVERLAKLKVELKHAVRQEAYEKAATLRDLIQQLEKEMTAEKRHL